MTIIIYLIISVVFGFIAFGIAASRDMEGGFWWGFFLGVIGIIIVALRPNDSKYSNYSSYQPSSSSTTTSSERISLFNANQNAGIGSWTCLCGRTNLNTIGICSCGKTKVDVLTIQYNEKEKQKNELQIIEEQEEQKEEEKSKDKIAEDNLKLDVLKKLKELLDMGAISQEEYDEKKKQYLN